MARADAEALRTLLPILRQLREIKGLKEAQSGIFTARREPFLQFHDDGGVLHAELKKPGGAGFDRFALATPAEQRKLVDEARFRARRFDDD
ncbi:MAG: hypothetical protein ACXWUL_02750 [Caldimonas sp.]